MKQWIVLLLMLVTGVRGVGAQDVPTLQCTLEQALAGSSQVTAALNTAIDALNKGNITAFLEALDAEQAAIAQVKAECSGLVFEGKSPKVIGPITFPSGIYRATATTQGYFIASLQVISGTCDVGYTGLFFLVEGQASDGAQSVLKSEDCVALIKLDQVTQSWTLAFELIE